MGAGEGGGEMAAAAVSLDGVRDKNVMQLKKLNTALFPVRYNDKYYADALASGDFTRLGCCCRVVKTRSQTVKKRIFEKLTCSYFSDICVGSIACRLEKKEGGAICVYIMTLGVLAPYRGLGVGTKLLNHVLDLSHKQNIWEIYLHVQTNNDDAIAFYKKFGFEITDTIRNYYMNISPPDCYVLSKVIPQPHSKK
ncbi:uncharacterized protein LOC103990127 isoform X1 [Musa acuminata AAA Group]|uniref:uncharacterized protein LOC103990127 isoform X1 n=1 Tax=Musa acuminata AAA Group TaxID=214697 RepID=UPI0031E25471